MIELPSRTRRIELLVSFIMVPAIALLIAQHWFSSRSQILVNAEAQASLIGASGSAALVFNDALNADEVAAHAKQLPQTELIAFYRPSGELLAFRGQGTPPPQQITPVTAEDHRFNLEELVLDQPVLLDDKVIGSIRLRISLEGFYGELLRFIGGLTLIVLITLSLYAVASRRTYRRMEQAEDALRYMALHDRITGLANRHAFELSLDQTLQRHQREGKGSALLFVDVDGFKKVNDLFGHHVGDEILTLIAQRLAACLRTSDILARLGGDEFGAILLGSDNPDHAARVVAHIVEVMAEPFATGALPVQLGVSIGIAMIPRDGANGGELLAHADMAMYQAKNSGKNTYRFFSDMIGNAVRARLDLELELRAAIQHDQLLVEYQPQVDAGNGRVLGLEALVRWRHPERGLVPPNAFIPVAEDSDLIISLGEWVLIQVCRDISKLKSLGLQPPPVAINISARQFSRGSLTSSVTAALASHGLRPHDLEIELTESAIMDHAGDAGTILDALHHAGLRLAVDDFGTGYSSLSYLKRLPVDKLKIDRSFIMNLSENPEDQAIVIAVIGVAEALGLQVVAEGVETEAQAELLREAGCHILQGYLTGRPSPIEQISQRLPARGVSA